jgi:beta-phosphoglucomutase-like phosphatase (HAD superfamily)
MKLPSNHPALPRRTYQAIIFDCDGTLTDSMPVHFLAWHETMTAYGVDFPEDRFYALGGMPSDQIIRLLASEQAVSIDAAEVAQQKEASFLRNLHLLEPIEAVLEVANFYRNRIPIAVASGGFREIIELQLERIGCRSWFSAVVTAEDTERHKPQPDVFLEAARRLGVAPKECLVYEDSDLGIQAAKAAAMDWIDVRTFYSAKRIPIKSA